LRNTQLIYQIAPTGWARVHLAGVANWHVRRDRNLATLKVRPDIRREEVTVFYRVDDKVYDELLASSVVVGELYGAAANNVTVECMARGTPLIVNRLPAIEQYLGVDYPLFYSDISEIATLLTEENLLAANTHLLERAKILPSFEQFARQVVEFGDQF
jgi:hypothetical protein